MDAEHPQRLLAEKDPQFCEGWMHSIIVLQKQIDECTRNAKRKLKNKDKNGAKTEIKNRRKLQPKMDELMLIHRNDIANYDPFLDEIDAFLLDFDDAINNNAMLTIQQPKQYKHRYQ